LRASDEAILWSSIQDIVCHPSRYVSHDVGTLSTFCSRA
jgi:hypothetical protein